MHGSKKEKHSSGGGSEVENDHSKGGGHGEKKHEGTHNGVGEGRGEDTSCMPACLSWHRVAPGEEEHAHEHELENRFGMSSKAWEAELEKVDKARRRACFRAAGACDGAVARWGAVVAAVRRLPFAVPTPPPSSEPSCLQLV